MEKTSTGPLRITCPHLGAQYDRTTVYAYPSQVNTCYNCKIPTPPSDLHQEKFCLTTIRNECPVFNQDKTLPFPPDLAWAGAEHRSPATLWRKLIWAGLGLVVVIVASYLISIYLHSGNVALPAFLAPQSVVVLPSSPTGAGENIIPVTGTSPTYTQESTATAGDPVKPTSASTKTSAPTLMRTLTSTPKPSPTLPSQKYRLETPFTVNGHQFLIHMVNDGENYELLAQTYNTRINVIMAINYLATSPLWAKSAIIIAPDLLVEDSSIPVLQADLIVEQSTTIDERAQKFNADPALTRLYNNCVDNCKLYAGDWIVIPHSR